MYDLIPFVLADEQKHNKAEKHFDGTTRLGKALVVVNQFVAKWRIGQCLIRLQLLTKSMTGEEIARELVSILSVEYSISVVRLLGHGIVQQCSDANH